MKVYCWQCGYLLGPPGYIEDQKQYPGGICGRCQEEIELEEVNEQYEIYEQLIVSLIRMKRRNKMREIRFRLRVDNKIVGYEKWYPGHQVEGDSCEASPCWLYSKDGEYWNPIYIHHKQKDQFTGLHDKNGKEIYEGDIVSENSKGAFEVEWQDGLITLSCYGGRPWYQLGVIKVIGNIYESKNLQAFDGWEILKESEDLVIVKHKCGAELTFEGYKSDRERAIKAMKEHECQEKK